MPHVLDLDADISTLVERVLEARQKVVTLGVKMETSGWELGFHSHAKAQLLLALTGVAA